MAVLVKVYFKTVFILAKFHIDIDTAGTDFGIEVDYFIAKFAIGMHVVTRFVPHILCCFKNNYESTDYNGSRATLWCKKSTHSDLNLMNEKITA